LRKAAYTINLGIPNEYNILVEAIFLQPGPRNANLRERLLWHWGTLSYWLYQFWDGIKTAYRVACDGAR